MAIEAEQKAHVRDPDRVEAALGEYGYLRRSTYHDTYFDSGDGRLVAAGHELRVRVISTDGGTTSVLTAKGDIVDEASGSKRETETAVDDPDATRTILEQLGFREYIAFTKQCANVDVSAEGYEMLATLVRVPEIDGVFIELETVIDDKGDLGAAMAAIHGVLNELGITEADHTTETYTGTVAAARTAG